MNAAWDVLKDQRKRADYDARRRGGDTHDAGDTYDADRPGEGTDPEDENPPADNVDGAADRRDGRRESPGWPPEPSGRETPAYRPVRDGRSRPS